MFLPTAIALLFFTSGHPKRQIIQKTGIDYQPFIKRSRKTEETGNSPESYVYRCLEAESEGVRDRNTAHTAP